MSDECPPGSVPSATAPWRHWLVVIVATVALAACGSDNHGELKPELAEALDDKWAPIFAANKIGRVDFDGSRMTVKFGVSGDVQGDIDATQIPNYSDDPVAFTVLVHRVPGGPDMEVYADFQQPPYRLYRVRRDMDELLHYAMTLFLRSREMLDN